MKNFCISLLVIFFCIFAAGCSKTDSALNGTWISEIGNTELKLNNGNFEHSEDGVPFMKGTYTTENSNITLTITHYYSDVFESLPDSVWYSRSDIKKIIESRGRDISESELDEIFTSKTDKYSVSGNKLVYNMETFKRK